MQQKSTTYMKTLLNSGVEWRFGLDILKADEVTPLENVTQFDMNATDRMIPGSATVTLDTSAKYMRSMTVSLRNADGRYLIGAAGIPSGGTNSQLATGLVWYNVRYRPWIDLVVGFDQFGNKMTDRTYMGIFVLTSPDTQVQTTGATVTLTLLDKSSLLSDPFLITNATLPTYVSNTVTVGGYAAGTSFDTAMKDLATKGGIPAAKQLFEPSTLTLPANYPIVEASEWWVHLTALAGSMSHVIYFDALGNLIRRSDPRLTSATSVFTFTTGQKSILNSIDRKSDLSNTYNHVVALGGSSTTADFRGEATVQNPANPYHANQIGDRIVYVGPNGKLKDTTPDPNIGSTAQANAKAGVILSQVVGEQDAVTIVARPVPPFDAYDRFTTVVVQSGLSTDFYVQKITWPLSLTTMSLDSVKWFAVGS